MDYIQQSLGPREEIIRLGQFHWMHDVKAVFNIIFGIIMAAMVIVGGVYAFYKLGRIPPHLDFQQAIYYLPLGLKIFAFLMFVMGLYSFSRMIIEKNTTEMAITNHRVIYKTGLLARHVGEISVDRIEGVVVVQSLWGRVFDYGQLAVRGMGVGEVMLPTIREPVEFRQAIQEARDYAEIKKGDALDEL